MNTNYSPTPLPRSAEVDRQARMAAQHQDYYYNEKMGELLTNTEPSLLTRIGSGIAELAASLGSKVTHQPSQRTETPEMHLRPR